MNYTPFISKDYILWVIKEYGSDHHIISSNCQGNPVKEGDYVFDYGTAKELLENLYEENKARADQV